MAAGFQDGCGHGEGAGGAPVVVHPEGPKEVLLIVILGVLLLVLVVAGELLVLLEGLNQDGFCPGEPTGYAAHV